MSASATQGGLNSSWKCAIVHVNLRQRALTCVNAHWRPSRTSPYIEGYIQYMQMLYVNVICEWCRHYLRHQNATQTRHYFQPNNWVLLLLRQRTLTCVATRQRASWCVITASNQIKPVLICALHDVRQRAATCAMWVSRDSTRVTLRASTRVAAAVRTSIYSIYTVSQ